MPTTADLGQQVKAKHPGLYEDLPDEEVGRRVKAKFPGSYDDFVDAPVAQLSAMPSQSQRMRNRTLAFLPTAGGYVGGLMGAEAGPWGAIGGAALGGAAGKSAQQAFLGRPASPGELGGSALAQGSQEALGLGMSGVAGKFGRGVVRKMVRFQKAPTPSVILNEFGRPFMVEGKAVQFQKATPKTAGHAADMAVDVATHMLGPGGALLRPVMRSRGVRSALASGASGLGKFVSGRGFRNFASQFPRAAMALKQLATYEEPDSTAGP